MNPLRCTLFFFVLGPGFLLLSVAARPVFCKLVFGNASLSFFLVALGYAALGPKVFSKQEDGGLPFWSYLLHWPYFVFNWITFTVFQLTDKKVPYTRISENLFLGRLPTFVDRPKIEEIRISNVLDLTCEFPEPAFLRKAPIYMCLPLMDTQAPTLRQLEEWVSWIDKNVRSGPTFVHCAFGHGRSVTFVIGYLLSKDPALTVEKAIQRLKNEGRRVQLTKEQIERLHQFKLHLHKGPRSLL